MHRRGVIAGFPFLPQPQTKTNIGVPEQRRTSSSSFLFFFLWGELLRLDGSFLMSLRDGVIMLKREEDGVEVRYEGCEKSQQQKQQQWR